MYERILVPVDGSPAARRGLNEAIGLARLTGAKLVLLHVVESFALAVEFDAIASYEDGRSLLEEAGRSALSQASAQVRQAGIVHRTVLRDPTPRPVAEVIVEEAGRHECGLIVMGTHGRRGFNRLMLGSNAALVARSAAVPVLVVRGAE